MKNQTKSTDSIPRASISQILETLSFVDSCPSRVTFDRVRMFLQQKSERSVGSREAMWTTARDVLSELQRLSFVTVGILPRKRSEVNKLLDTPCEITDAGHQLANLFAEKPSSAFDHLLVTWMNEHLYYRKFIGRLLQAPLYVTDVTNLKQLGADKHRPQDMDPLVAAIVGSCVPRMRNASFVEERVMAFEEGIRRRVEQLQTVVLSDLETKRWIDAIEDSVVLPSLLEVENLPFDPVTFQHLLRVSQEFLSAAWTSAHPDFEGRIVFATCQFQPELSNDENTPVSHVTHHGQAFAISRFASSLLTAYRRLAGTGAGYVDAHAVRAMVCVDLRVQPQVFSACLASLIEGRASSSLTIYTELPFAPPPPGESYIEIGHNRIGRLKLVSQKRSETHAN